MRLISNKALREFALYHRDAGESLQAWRKLMRIGFGFSVGNAHDVEVVDYRYEKIMAIRMEHLAKTKLADVLAQPRKRLAITHPGQFLFTEFMEPMAA